MPEGHSVHRIARQFDRHFVGKTISVTSPQGRFASGAAELDGLRMIAAKAVGKQLFLEFEHDRHLRVHLGIYGAWEFAGAVAEGWLIGQGDAVRSMGAPRVTRVGARVRMAEQEDLRQPGAAAAESFPPEPVGAVRVRLLADDIVGDLRGPTACEVLGADEVRGVLARLGPDPLVDRSKKAEDRFVATVLRKPTPIALLLMDQSVVSGIGNVYRAELLFRARLDPHTPGLAIPEAQARAIWKDWAKLLAVGVELGKMMTMGRPGSKVYAAALADRADRYWVYHRAGQPCRVCSTPIALEELGGRKLYWCPECQA